MRFDTTTASHTMLSLVFEELRATCVAQSPVATPLPPPAVHSSNVALWPHPRIAIRFDDCVRRQREHYLLYSFVRVHQTPRRHLVCVHRAATGSYLPCSEPEPARPLNFVITAAHHDVLRVTGAYGKALVAWTISQGRSTQLRTVHLTGALPALLMLLIHIW